MLVDSEYCHALNTTQFPSLLTLRLDLHAPSTRHGNSYTVKGIDLVRVIELANVTNLGNQVSHYWIACQNSLRT
ncbi:MAG: hypothetical protein ACI8RD_002671 [Bacillariaceae sp.]|jgi:hypothetical protein